MNTKKIIFIISAITVLFVALPRITAAETPEEKGLDIAVEADRRDTGFGDYRAEMVMTLRDRHGDESIRQLNVRGLEVDGDGDKYLAVFIDPRDIKGTAFLTYSHKSGSDDQWLYLPALKRVKRIAPANKTSSFMGSEFAYEDLASEEIEKYNYRYLRDEAYEGKDTFVFERYPVDQNSGYSRQVVWMDKKEYRQLRIDFYDRKDELLKTLTFKGYRLYLDKYWRAHEMLMDNQQTGKSTTLEWKNYKFRTGLDERDFDTNALKRAR